MAFFIPVKSRSGILKDDTLLRFVFFRMLLRGVLLIIGNGAPPARMLARRVTRQKRSFAVNLANGMCLRECPTSSRWSALSAIGALEFLSNDLPYDLPVKDRKRVAASSLVTATLTIYHNRNARVALSPRKMKPLRFLQYVPTQSPAMLADFPGMQRTVLRNRYTRVGADE